MVSDAVLIALIRETVQPASVARQAAARWLLQAYRQNDCIDTSEAGLEVLRAEEGRDVASEVIYLLERLGEGHAPLARTA